MAPHASRRAQSREQRVLGQPSSTTTPRPQLKARRLAIQPALESDNTRHVGSLYKRRPATWFRQLARGPNVLINGVFTRHGTALAPPCRRKSLIVRATALW